MKSWSGRAIALSLSLSLSFFLAAWVFPAGAAADPSSVDGTGTVLVGGEPFFPIAYYSRWNAPHAERMHQLRAVADAGFNVMLGEANRSSEGEDYGRLVSEFGELLDAAGARGVKILTKYFGAAGSPVDAELVRLFRSRPAVLGWILQDDVNDADPAAVAAAAALVRAADPFRLTYVSAFAVTPRPPKKPLSAFLGAADLVGVQAYPVTKGPLVGAWRTWADAVAASPGKPVIANVQTFAWGAGRYPTPDEVTVMTYLAAAAGVKGIAYYTFHDNQSGTTIDVSRPGLWERTGLLARELGALSSYLTRGVRDGGTSEGAVWATWRLGDAALAVVVNPTERPADVLVPLPGAPGGPDVARRPGCVRAGGAALSCRLAPFGVSVTEVPAVVPAVPPALAPPAGAAPAADSLRAPATVEGLTVTYSGGRGRPVTARVRRVSVGWRSAGTAPAGGGRVRASFTGSFRTRRGDVVRVEVPTNGRVAFRCGVRPAVSAAPGGVRAYTVAATGTTLRFRLDFTPVRFPARLGFRAWTGPG